MFALWLLAAAGLGGMAAWLAVEGQRDFAPLLLFPIVLGIGLGAMNVGLMRLAQMGNRPTAILGTLLAVGRGRPGPALSRLSPRGSRQPATDRGDAAVGPASLVRELVAPPAGFADYLRRQAARADRCGHGYVLTGWAAWLSWAIDGLLVLAAALAMVIPATRQPYCNACRSWYRTVRAGRLCLAVAMRLAEAGSAKIEDPVKWVRYRLSCCQGGCSPTRLELFWEAPDPRGHSSIETWLDVEHRNQAVQAWIRGKGEGGRRKDK